MKSIIYTLISLIVFISSLLPQESENPFVVSPLIGDTLSLAERNFYQLFPQIEGFQWAVFYLNPDSSLNTDVKYLIDELARDTLIQNYKSLKTLNYHIYARNALENETPVRAFNYKTAGYSEGADVNVYMTNGLEASGELLFVRENSLLILKPECKDNLINPDCISHMSSVEIDKLIIEGNSNLGWGIGFGLLASVIAGVLIYQSNFDSSRWLSGAVAWEKSKLPIILSTVGCFTLGVTIGIYTSTPDEVIEPFSEDDLKGLSFYSRYQMEEPNELKKIK